MAGASLDVTNDSRSALVFDLDEQIIGDAIFQAVIAHVPAYAKDAVAERGEVREHCMHHGVATYATFCEGAVPSAERLAFVRDTASRRARQNVPLAILLHAYRAGYAAVWTTVRERVQTIGTDLETLLHFAELMMEYFNAVSSEAAQAYVAERARVAADARMTQQRLLEQLLSAEITHSDEIAPQLAAFGLHRGRGCRVVVVAHVDDGAGSVAGPSADTLDATGAALRRHDGPPLAALIHGRAVLVLPALGVDEPSIEERLATLPAPAGGWIAAGLSTPQDRLHEAPRAYAEALLALRIARRGRPVVSLASARLFDAMLAETSRAMRRLLPPWTRALIEEDPASALVPTLLAYVDADLNIARAAAHLAVHPNTVRYRLHRIEAITATSTKSFRDLIEILA